MELIMTAYECNRCGMSVNAACGKCDEKLFNDTLENESGSLQVSKCPNGH